ncbi:ABC transporter substrate-binding protein [Haloprofundus marisrubri]|uniref:ABC transporter substrate-binding protein n=1 Tax=Haloprofundus marisrubri TaxID=1514971 RepID=A0A0W1R9P4_9EURY|nr:ABC transporter substrate-binding protein [Haloprofundus marisrubri]KTG10188.1 ABC transporter substrate-binding protein [Haloprofundus marisrubri]
MSNDNNKLDRRTLLKLSGAGGISFVVAGCLEGGSGDGEGTDGGNGSGGGGSGNDSGGSGGSGGGSDSYTIGMVDSLTGSLAPYGERNERGRELALSAINEAGIGDGGQMEVIVEDDESTNQAGVNAARKLVNQDGVPLIVGTVGSGVSIAIHDSVVSGTDTVQISQNSTSPALTDKPDLLRTSPSGNAKGRALAQLIGEDHDSVAVTWINNDYGQGLSEVFANSFEGNVAYNTPHDQGQSSYRGQLSEMAGTNATAWLFITYADEYTVMVNEAYDQGFNEQVDYYGAESTIADAILENTEPGSQNGMTGVTESAPTDQESYQNFRDTFEEEFGQTPTVWAAYAYDAITIAALSVEAADEFTGAALSEVVRDVTRPDGQEVFSFEEAKGVLADGGSAADINYQGVSGPIDLDDNGDPKGFYQVYSVEDHEYVFGDFITG